MGAPMCYGLPKLQIDEHIQSIWIAIALPIPMFLGSLCKMLQLVWFAHGEWEGTTLVAAICTSWLGCTLGEAMVCS